ncbi:MAG: TetR/AcrR family transcriptional regulator [Acidimicrobiales bacterium]
MSGPAATAASTARRSKQRAVTPKRTDPVARRAHLLDAAIRAIRTIGADASMSDIAAEAGVSKPVLYDSFRDKSGLAAALADRFLGELDTTLLDTVTAEISPREALGTTIGVFVRFAEREPELYRFLVEGSAGTGREAVELPMLTSLAERIAGYLTGPVATIDDPERAESWAFAIMGMVFSSVGWWLDGRTRTRAQLVDDLTDLICGGLGGGGVDIG